MQAKEAEELRQRWSGGKCEHPSLEKEYAGGISTGDYVCSRCGATGWGRDWVEKEISATD